MSVKIIVGCDGNECSEDLEFFGSEFDIDEVTQLGWSHDSCNDCHYCPLCVKKMIRSGELELSSEQAEY